MSAVTAESDAREIIEALEQEETGHTAGFSPDLRRDGQEPDERYVLDENKIIDTVYTLDRRNDEYEEPWYATPAAVVQIVGAGGTVFADHQFVDGLQEPPAVAEWSYSDRDPVSTDARRRVRDFYREHTRDHPGFTDTTTIPVPHHPDFSSGDNVYAGIAMGEDAVLLTYDSDFVRASADIPELRINTAGGVLGA